MTLQNNILAPYINGSFTNNVKNSEKLICKNPSKPTDILAIMQWERSLVDNIVDSMKKALNDYKNWELNKRLVLITEIITAIKNNSEEMKSLMMLELARSRYTVEEEWKLCDSFFNIIKDYSINTLSAKNISNNLSIKAFPVGHVLISSTVALPIYTLITSSLLALVAGNTITIKPSSHCPLSSSLLISCFHQAQVPVGLVQMIYGNFDIFRKLILSYEYNVILYSGGEETREQIRKDMFNYDKSRLVLCSPGKNIAIVDDTNDIDDTVNKIIYGSCADTGQRLEATGIVFVQKANADNLIDKLIKGIKKLPIGVKEDLNNETHVMGPLCSLDSYERFLRFQGIAYRESNETLRWGKGIDNLGNGYYVSPGLHVINSDKVSKSVYANSAFFGPDIAVVPVDDIEQAINITNNILSCNICSIFSKNNNTLNYVFENTNVPVVYCNIPTTEVQIMFPINNYNRLENTIGMSLDFLNKCIYWRGVSK